MSRADEVIDRLQAEIVKRDARITELEAQAGDGTSINKYRAELSALKAGQGEAVAYAQANLADIFEGSTVSVILRNADADGCYTLPLYTAPPTSADDRLVPVELLKRIAREADHYDDSPVATINDNCELWQIGHVRLKMTVGDLRELRALLAQSQEVKS